MLTPEQLKERKTGIGGSDVAAICGLSQWRTPLDVYLSKIDESYEKEQKNQKEYNKFIYWGNKLEAVVRKEYEDLTGETIILPEKLMRKSDMDFMIANVDGIIFNKNAILECKTASAYKISEWGDSGTDAIPTPYLLQVAHYALVANADYVDIAVLLGGNDFRIYKYQRNENLEKYLMRKEERFWNEHVLKRIPPEASDKKDIKTLYSLATNNTSVMATYKIIEHLERIKSIKAAIKNYEKEYKHLEIIIKNHMQNADALTDEFGHELVTWKNRETAKIDAATLKSENPELYKQYEKKSQYRVFLLKGE